MRIALFEHDDHTHVGIVTDFGLLDFTRAFQAQQLIQHGHIELNNRKHDIPSAILSVGDRVRLRQKSRNIDSVKNALDRAEALGRPTWLSVDPEAFEGTINAIPDRNQIDATLNEQLIVEFYSR